MVTLEKYSMEEMKEVYPLIYQGVFLKYSTEGNCPTQIYLGKDGGKYIGFVAGYQHSPTTWYMQRAGYTKSEQGRAKVLSRTRQVIDIIHKEYRSIMTLVENTDFPTLKTMLHVGFKIIGVRMDTAGKLWVELIHSREEVRNG